MIDYEDVILARQERIEIEKDGDIDTDDCERCDLLPEYRRASEGGRRISKLSFPEQ